MKTKPKVNESMLQDLLAEVQQELNALSKNETLVKAVPEDLPEGAPSDPAPAAAAADPMDGSALVPPAEASGAAPHAEPDGDEGAEVSAAPEGAEGAIEPAPTVEELQAEYQKLDPEELKMHFEACKAALAMAMGQAPEASAAPAPMAPPEASAAPAMKTEMKSHDGSGAMSAGKAMGKAENTPIKPLTKSVRDLEMDSLKAELANHAKAMEKLIDFVAAPVRKAVKNVSEIPYLEKGEKDAAPVTKEQVTAVLREKVRSGKLTKAETDKVLSFYNTGSIELVKGILSK